MWFFFHSLSLSLFSRTGQPEPPYNCTVSNQTSDSIEIFCKEGFDNGQTQSFYAEVIDPDTDVLMTNISSTKLTFKIVRLSPGKALRMNIYAVNTRGKSEPVVVETFTLESAQKHTGELTPYFCYFYV